MPGKVHSWEIHGAADGAHQYDESCSCGLDGGSTGMPGSCCLEKLLFSFLVRIKHAKNLLDL